MIYVLVGWCILMALILTWSERTHAWDSDDIAKWVGWTAVILALVIQMSTNAPVPQPKMITGAIDISIPPALIAGVVGSLTLNGLQGFVRTVVHLINRARKKRG